MRDSFSSILDDSLYIVLSRSLYNFHNPLHLPFCALDMRWIYATLRYLLLFPDCVHEFANLVPWTLATIYQAFRYYFIISRCLYIFSIPNTISTSSDGFSNSCSTVVYVCMVIISFGWFNNFSKMPLNSHAISLLSVIRFSHFSSSQ